MPFSLRQTSLRPNMTIENCRKIDKTYLLGVLKCINMNKVNGENPRQIRTRAKTPERDIFAR